MRASSTYDDQQQAGVAGEERSLRSHPPLLWWSLAGLGVFALVLVLVLAGGPVPHLDEVVRDGIDAHRHDALTRLADAVTDVFSPLVDALVLTAGAVTVAWRRRRLWPVASAAVTGWVMVVAVVVVKHAVGRPPPYPGTVGSTSFPSGHTASVLVCLGALALLVGRWRPAWRAPMLGAVAALTALVAASLVYAGYHWLSDCVASVALGSALLGFLQLWLSRRTASRSSGAGTPPTGRTAPRR